MYKQLFMGIGLFFTLVLSYDFLFEVPDRLSLEVPAPYGQFATAPTFNGIIRLTTSGNKAFCSGFVIDKNYAITATHCVRDRFKKVIKVWNNVPEYVTDAIPLGYDSVTDLALLGGDFSQFKPLPVNLTHSGFDSTDGYYLCGYPLGEKRVACNSGSVIENLLHGVKMKAVITYGMSGGPVLDPNGVAVGLNTAVDDGFVLASPLQGFLGLFPGLE